MTTDSVRVAVFVDWQNVYKTAREAFGLKAMPNEYGNISPYKLGRLLAAAGGRGKAGELVCVEVHRGLPSQNRDPTGYAANRRQAAAWTSESKLVVPKMRPLRYPQDYPRELPVEKGVDVALAVNAIEATLQKRCEVAVIFTHDTDLLPVPETITRLAGAGRVETVSWASDSFQRRLRPKGGVAHHPLSRTIFTVIEDQTNYARKS